MQKLFEAWREFREGALKEVYAPGLEHGKWSKEEYGIFDALSDSKDLPLHIRAFARYLSGSGRSWTERDFTEEQKKQLIDLVLYVQWQNMRFARDVEKNPESWKNKKRSHLGWKMKAKSAARRILDDDAKGTFHIGSYNVYPRHQGMATTTDRSEEDVPKQNLQGGLPLLGGNFAEQIERFLGRTTVNFDRGKSLTIVDLYDFDQLENQHGTESEIKDLTDAIMNFFSWYSLVPSQFYIKVREMAPHTGKEFPIRIHLKL
tara:strand:+ start:113 stop:892 length:780 start_codon:yes stop_codon:yes gene_type:complete